MSCRIPWLLLTFIPLALYSGMINGTFLSLDESEILQDLDRFSLNIRHYFLPVGGSVHLYYRPIQGLSLLVDRLMWGTQSSGFHLTNIMLHVANVLLVYALALKVTFTPHRRIVAFLAALLFAVHPIHTEAVDWIAGRTDLLATFFGLGSFLTYLRFRNDCSWRYLFVSAACYLVGLFAKEVAIAVPLVIVAYELIIHQARDRAKRLQMALAGAGCYGVATGFYLWLRHSALSRGDVGIARSMGALDVAWFDQGQLLLSAVGFYMTKLVLPFPLNFAVGPIDTPVYLGLGLLAGAVACVAAIKRREESFWIWWVILTLSPSLIIAITGMAWTSVAERYLYFPSVGFSILAVLFLFAVSARIVQSPVVPGTAIVAVCVWFFAGTYSRNLVWQEPMLLWEDTVRKSPAFPIAYNEYGIALMADRRYDEAKQQFEKAIELGYRAKPLENLALMAVYIDHDPQDAEKLLTRAIEGGGQKGKLYSRLATNYAQQAGSEQTSDSIHWLRMAIASYEQAYTHHGDAVALYRIGQLYIRLEEYEKARSFFERAIENGGPDDFFVAPSKAIVLKLANQRG